MDQEPTSPAQAEHRQGDLLMLALLAVVAGAATGLMVATFKLALARVGGWRNAAGAADRSPFAGPIAHRPFTPHTKPGQRLRCRLGDTDFR